MGYFPATTEKSCQIYCEIKLVFFYKGAAILKQCILQGRWGRTFKDHNCYVQRSKYESAGGSNHWTIRLALHSSAFYPCGQLEPGFVQSGQPHATGHAKKLRLTTAGARALFFQVWDTLWQADVTPSCLTTPHRKPGWLAPSYWFWEDLLRGVWSRARSIVFQAAKAWRYLLCEQESKMWGGHEAHGVLVFCPVHYGQNSKILRSTPRLIVYQSRVSKHEPSKNVQILCANKYM